MSNRVSYIITDNNITVNYAGQTHIVSRQDALANKLIDAIRNKKTDEIPRLVEVATRVVEYGRGNFSVEDNRIMINGVAAPTLLSNKILRFMNEGLPVEPLIKFAENLLKNPSYRSVNELFQFLEKNDHPITDNGCFIAYKKVREDFKDVHSGTFDNSPGKVVEVPRNQVDENSAVTCSNGLHVANWDYASSFYGGGKMLEVEVNPADVVAIPVDYNQAKMRCCRYTVLGVVDQKHSSETVLRNTKPAVSVVGTCDECAEVCDVTEGLCDNCAVPDEKKKEKEKDYCSECEYPLTQEEMDSYYAVCVYCSDEDEDEEEEEEEEGGGGGEDQYPWEDELDEEE